MTTLDAEYEVLGCLMIHGAEAAEVLTKLREDYFPTHGLKTAYKALHEAIISGGATDAISLNHATKGSVGVPMAIEMQENGCSVQRALSYCEIIHDKWAIRELRGLGFTLTNEPLDSADSISMIQRTLMLLDRPDSHFGESIKVGMKRVLGDIQSRYEAEEMSGVPTGYKLLDYASDGWQKQTLNILSGVPGSGKTTMAMAMAMEASKTVPVLFFSMEMGFDQLLKRMLCSLGQIDMTTMTSGRFKDEDWPKLTVGVNRANVFNDNLIVDCNPSVTPAYIRQKANEVILKHGKIGLVVIDYFRLMESPKGEKTLEATTTNALGVNKLKKELDCPILMLAQINKDAVKGGHRPNQGDLDWGQQLGRDADNIFYLYTNDQLNEDRVVHFYSSKTRSMQPVNFYLNNNLQYNRLEEREHPYKEPEREFKGLKY